MSNRDTKGAFRFRCSREVFAEEELEILKRFGSAFEQLSKGERVPTTDAQQRFLEVAQGQRQPKTIYERTWAKYQWRVEWESKNATVMGTRRAIPNDREDWKRMSGALWGEAIRRALDD